MAPFKFQAVASQLFCIEMRFLVGGYFMIGAVISADMDLIGQLLPNSATRFIRVTMDEALRARKDRENLLNKIRKYLE
tara:strand:- start:2758 stop:2991 length:234 start_codon:yes stop_codon:yes gene_type:complete